MAGDGLRLGVLGPLAVVRDGEPVPLAGRRRRALLSLLVLHAGEPMSSDRLADELWSGRPPPTARTALQMHIRAIRQAVGPALPLRTVPGGYVLELAAGASDAEEFQRRAAAGAEALQAGDPAGALRELAGALALWRGPALAELADMPSARADAARLEELRLAAREARIDAELALGRHVELPAALGPLIAEHPYRERLRAQLMLALYRSGRQADALTEYQRARDTLVGQLGLEPGEELQRLQRAVLAHDPALDPAAPARPPAAPDSAGDEPVRLERKTVTTLLAALHADGDPEDARERVLSAADRIGRQLERFGGTPGGLSAGALPTLFGVPAAHEDDPERAVRAALAIDPQPGIEVRVAITTAEELVGDAQAATGSGTRLLPVAPPGGVLVDERTYRATRGAIGYRAHAGAWEALAAHAPIHGEPPWRGALVGRRRELAVLQAALARVRGARSCALVTLVGTPGIGKSRLAGEFADGCDDARVLRGRSLPYGSGVSLWALGEIVKALAGIREGDAADVAERQLSAAVAAAMAGDDRADWVLRHARVLVGRGEPAQTVSTERRGEEFAAWRTLFEALADQTPLVLVFEDVHWADDGLLDFLDHVADWATDAPILVLVTARPELLERRPAWGGGKPDSTTLPLPPLADGETDELIHALTAGRLAPAQARGLSARSGGNPLFVEQYVEMLRDGETVADVPDSVRAILAARLDALPAAEKALLHHAAVVGHVFWPGAIAVTGGAPVDDAGLHALERRQLVRRQRGSAVAGQPEYRFAHALLADVAYAQIPRSERVDEHLRAAGWIESLGRVDDHAELLAHHYGRALELLQSSGRDIAPIAPAARAALTRAGDRALALHAWETAERFYADARALWPEDAAAERADLLYRAAIVAFERGREDAAQALERGRAAVAATGDRARAAELDSLLAEVWWTKGDSDRAADHRTRAARLVRDAPSTPAKARVLSLLVGFDVMADRYDPERARIAAATAEALGLDELRAEVTTLTGMALQRDDDGAVLEPAVRAALDGNWLRAAVAGCTGLTTLRACQGRMREALEVALETERVSIQLGNAIYWRWARNNLVPLWLETGDWTAAAREADAFLDESRRAGGHYGDSAAADTRALLRLGRGDDDGALADVAFALERSRAAGDPQALCPTLGIAAAVAASAGHPAVAQAHLAELLAQGARGLAHVEYGMVDAVRAAIAAGCGEALGALLKRDEAWPLHMAARALLDGDAAAAAQILDAGGAARSAALCRLDCGDRAQLEAARAFFAGVGATRHAQDAERRLVALPASATAM